MLEKSFVTQRGCHRLHQFVIASHLRLTPPELAPPAKLQVQRADVGFRLCLNSFCPISVSGMLSVTCILDLQRLIMPVASEVDYKVP